MLAVVDENSLRPGCCFGGVPFESSFVMFELVMEEQNRFGVAKLKLAENIV